MCEITYENIVYPSTEHAYQACKSLDENERLKIAKLATAGQSKRAGHQLLINSLIRDDWEQVKNKVMYDVCKIKFQAPVLKLLLLETSDAHLIEGNTWHDNWYGVCYCRNCPKHKLQPVENQNHLGKILMQIREELKLQTV